MPVFRLTHRLVFPHPELAESDGLLAVGGDLSEKRLLLAYSQGIFPWYTEGYPILWWSPDPRLVLIPDELKVSRSLRQTLRKNLFTVTADTAFEGVIRSCAETPRKGGEGTWITEDMVEAYTRLHRSGYAHSIESWHNGELAGGLYGIALGKAFFGESMFARESNASKVAFARLVRKLIEWDFRIIDCQVTTRHLVSLGAKELPRAEFMALLRQALATPSQPGKWDLR
ncbi:MAG TPA: leucyl/phenylalanyl-tRNA--protein transferase [Dissulfurispiraceae bacterium]